MKIIRLRSGDDVLNICVEENELPKVLNMLEASPSVKAYKFDAGTLRTEDQLKYSGFAGYKYPAGKLIPYEESFFD